MFNGQVQTSSAIGPAVVTSPTVQNGVNGDTPSPDLSDDASKDPLKNVVSQLNVKLGNDAKKPENVQLVASSMGGHMMPGVHTPTTVASVSHFGQHHHAIPAGPHAANFPRLMHLPGHINGLPPGMVPMQALPGGVLPGGAMALPPGILPAGLVPGQPGIVPAGQAGLLPTPPHHMMLPLPAPSPVIKPGLQLMPGVPGAGLMGAVPGIIPGVPAGSVAAFQGALPGTIQGAIQASLPGSIPQTRSPSASALGQSRPITPEVPTAGYVANNVSGYTPAIYAATAGPGGLGQPIPVLTNGTVQTSGAHGTVPQQLPQVTMASSQPTVVSFAGLPGTAQATLQAIPGFPANAAGLTGLTSIGPNGLPAGMSILPAGAAATATPGAAAAAQMQQLAAYPLIGAYGQQLIPQQKIATAPGQNGLLQPAAASVPLQGVAGIPTAASATSLKRQIADPYGVMDKRIRLA